MQLFWQETCAVIPLPHSILIEKHNTLDISKIANNRGRITAFCSKQIVILKPITHI